MRVTLKNLSPGGVVESKSLQYLVLSCSIKNRAYTDYQPQPIDKNISSSYVQEPDKIKGSRNTLEVKSWALLIIINYKLGVI